MGEKDTDKACEPRQLTFDLPHLPALGAEDFVVSACNQQAVDLVERWPAWSAHAAIVAGPPGSGKSHLVSVWLARSGGDSPRLGRCDAQSRGEVVYPTLH